MASLPHRFVKPFLLIALGVETFCASYGLSSGRPSGTASIGYFFSGICIALLAFCAAPARLPALRSIQRPWIPAIKGIILLALGVAMFVIARYWFFHIPLDPDYADMLPVIKVMNERLLQGGWKGVYDPIPEIWHGTQPVYLPAMWVPYSIPLLFHVDLRWLTVAALFLSFAAFLWTISFRRAIVYPLILLAIGFGLFWWLFAMDDRHGLLSLSEEGLIACYYVFLVIAIVSGNIYLIGTAICLCMLSRYAMIGWLPAYLLYLVLKSEYRKITRLVIIGVVGFGLLLVLPFGVPVVQRLINLPGNYISFAGRVWADSPDTFWLSLGFAKFFGAGGTPVLHRLLIGLSFGMPLLFMGLGIYVGRRRELNNLPLATLKLALVFFYNFIDVPYLYLFYTSVFVSMITVSLLTGPGARPLPAGRY